MRRWTLAAAASALFAAALWHLPATAQRPTPATNPQPAAAQPAAARQAAPELITFDEYRDFRLNDIAKRQARLAQELAAPDLTAAQKSSLEGRKAYYDRLASMPPGQRDHLFHARFDEIDANHDGLLDNAERAAWREQRRAHYRELAAARANPDAARTAANAPASQQ